MSLKFDKRMLLVLAVFLMLVIIPISFAEDINDANVVGVNDDSVVDVVSESAIDDVQQSSGDNSSEILDVGSDEIEIKPDTSTVDNYTPGDSKSVAFYRNLGSGIDEYEMIYLNDNFYLFVNDGEGIETTASPSSSSFWINLNIIPTTSLHEGENTIKVGFSSGDASYLESFYTITSIPMTVNVPGSGGGPDEDDDSIWVNGSYTGDISDGNKTTPYKTIQAAISAVSSGSTIKIAETPEAYTLTSAITISKNVALVGVGDVRITRNGGNLFAKGSTFKGTISFTGITFRDVVSNSNDAIWYDHSSNSYMGDLKFINCTFINNKGYALISATDNVLLDGCTFINNTATGTSGGTRSAIVFKYNGQNAVITVTNSIFINNKMTSSYKHLFSDYSNGAKLVTSNSFWGTNDKPDISNIFNHGASSTTLNSWAVIEGSIAADVNVGDNPDLTLKFKSTNDGETYTEMTTMMPKLTVTLTPALGSINPATVTISNNVGTTSYSATTEGNEIVLINEGSQELANVTFYVDESPVGKLFVDASYTGGDSDGSKAKPYTTIKDALDNLGTNTQIVVKKGTYTLDNYVINNDVVINGKEDNVIITTNGASHITVASGKTVNLTNLIFKGATTNSIVSTGALSISDCLFENNRGTNVISSTEGTVDISYTVFNNNAVSGKIVDAIAGTVNKNFWGSNTPNVADTLTLNNYVIVNATIPSMREGNELESEVNHNINIKFVLDDGTELDKSLHGVTVTLSSTIGEVTESVVIVDNEASAQFISNVEGDGQIDVKLGDITLKTFTFTVIERETGRIFVNASYEGDDSDGSKAKPFKTLTEAITKNNNDGGNQEIIVNAGTYTSNYGYYTISKNVNITGRGTVIIDVKGSYFCGYTSSYSNLVLNNLIFTNGSKQSMFQYVKDLTINNCTVTNITGGSSIIEDARGNVKITDSSFTNIKFTGNYNLITLYSSSNSVDISNSVFNNITFSSSKYVLSSSNANINGNFWGTNDPSSLFPSYMSLGNWVVVNVTLPETIVQGQTPTLTVELKLNNGNSLTNTLPAFDLGLSSLLGNAFAPETLTISNNIGEIIYNAAINGNEVINITSGDKTIVSIERNIEEGDDPAKIFVDETSNVTDADGSKFKPFNNLKDAFDAITSIRNTVVILEGNYAISDYTLNKNATIRWSKKQVNIAATNLVIAADVSLYDLVFKGGNTITVNDGAKLTIEKTKFVNNTGGISSAGDLTITKSQFIKTTDTITATAGTVNIDFTEFVLSDAISIGSVVTGKINNNYWGDNVPTIIGGAELTNWIVLLITPNEIDINASEVQTFDISFKNTTDGSNFTSLVEEMPALEIGIAPTIGSLDKNAIILSDSDSVTYTATTEGAETINFTTSGIVFNSLSFNVGKSVAGKIFVSKDGSDSTGDGSRLKPFASLGKAIDAAESGNEIIISEGVYTESSYKTIYSQSLNLVITGVGNVVLTRNPATSYPYLINLYYGATFTFNNLIFANFNGGTSSYASVIQGPTSSSYGYATININNCTFANNTAGYSPIYVPYGYVTINESIFINNTATATGQNGALVFVQRGSLNINNSAFVDNDCRYKYYIYTYSNSYLTVDVNNNFWGSNDDPTSKFDSNYPNSIPKNWIIVNATIDSSKITAGDKPTIKLAFLSTDGENVTELTGVLPDVTVSLASVLNAVDETAIISNNIAEITYDAIKDGDEVITISLGENLLANLTFTVEEKDDGTKVFVDASYTGESDGSKDKPFTNLKDALDSAKETGKKYISVAQGTYEIADYEIASDVEIIGKKVVTVKATGLTINANTIFNNLIFNEGNAITVNADKNLSIYDSTFTNNAGVIKSIGNLLINATKFISNSPIDGKGIINALAGTINIAYSEFVNCDEGGLIVYSDVAGDVNNNYWSDNDEIKVSEIIKPTSWIILSAVLSSDDIKLDTEYDIALKFSINNGSDLDVAMPNLDVALASVIGSVTPIVTIQNNMGTATYLSNVEGNETINYGAGELTFEVTEDETGKLYVAPADYQRDTNKSIGSKANPYDNLASALSAASAGTEIIMFEGTYTTSSYYSVYRNNLKITGRGKVVLTSSSTAQSYFINAAGTSSYSAGYSITLTNLVFENITLSSASSYGILYTKGYGSYYSSDIRDLNVINCTFNNNKAPSVIYVPSYTNVAITGSVFYNNTCTGSSPYINCYQANTFNVNYNIFIDNHFTGYYGGVRGPGSGNVDYNFWGANTHPVYNKDYSVNYLNNWVVAEITIDNDNLTYSDLATVTVKFKYTADGENYTDLEKSMPTYTFDLSKVLGTIDDTITVENNIGEVTYTATGVGEEIIKVNDITNITFNVGKHVSNVEIIIDSDNYYVGDDFTIIIKNDSAPVKVIINDLPYEIDADGKVIIDTTILTANKYTIVATIDETEFYLANSTNASFTINKYNSHVEIIVDPSHFAGDEFSIIVHNDSAVKVTINGNPYEIDANGKVIVDTAALAAGEYTVVATIDENDRYLSNTTTANFTITSSLSVTVEKINEGEKLNITINDEAKTTGTAKLTIGNGVYYIEVVDGFGNDVLDTNLISGTYEINTVLGNYTNITSVSVGLRELTLPIEVTETLAGGKATIKVITPSDLMGDEITLFLDAVKYTITRENNFTFVTDPLNAGNHSVSALYLGDKIYGVGMGSTKFTVKRLPTSMEVTSAVIYAGEVAKITIELSELISDNVYVNIGGNKQIVALEFGYAELEIPNLKVGNYNVAVSYAGDDIFDACENNTATILVSYNDAGLKANSTDIKVGENATINIEINKDVTGIVKVNFGNAVYPVSLVDGKGVVVIPGLSEGTYTAYVIFVGDEIFAASEVNTTFIVSKVEIPSDINISMEIPEGTTAPEFTVNLPTDATGDFTVTVDGIPYTEPLVNGSATVKVRELPVGNHTIVSSYTGDNKYDGFTSQPQNVTIPKATIRGGEDALNMTTPSNSATPSFTIDLASDVTGNLTVTVDGKDTYTQILVSGYATVTVPELSSGKHELTVSYSGNEKYANISKTVTVNVPEPVVKLSKNKNIKMLYSAGTKYQVLVTVDGKAKAGVKVAIKFNGKTKNVKTNKKGYAIYKIPTVKPKKYTITATYSGKTVKNTVKVNNIIKAPNKTIKKSKKVTKVKITLKKVNKKYLKNKTLKIKFNGKTYKVKTNKKGAATWKVKKSMVQKLKANKKYAYKVTYGKDVVSKKLTIKK